ncbi:MAG: hypothetical protein A2X56_11435 [Nitrospirae bacterium GWC2_57_13]|nr:MAG: hypothetical protein A2X56_11435 [Nitrospirae bacterium GWC2_57_13]
MAGIAEKGEEKAWAILRTLAPEHVCRAAVAAYDAVSNRYTVQCYGMLFIVDLHERTITSSDGGSSLFLGKLSDFFRISLLWYLVNSKEVPCTGRLVKLQQISGGDIFARGSHILPLDSIAETYGKSREGFLQKGTEFGGEPASMGDAALRLFPFPRTPLVLVLWLEDEEFPARADLLVDSTCELHLATDIIWSVSMMTVLAMAS